MVVRLRLARHGTRNNPFYHVVAIADHKPRDARPIEKLGEYDPVPRHVLARPGPAYAVVSSNAIGSPHSSLPIDAYLGKQNKGKERDIYSNQGKVITSGIPKERDIKLEKKLEWNTARIAYWLDKGAQPSKTVARLLHRVSYCSSRGEERLCCRC
jgi:small subunit ribosomal protein S16